MNIFEQASREGLRFEYRGLCTVEELWRVPIEDRDGNGLNQMFKDLNRQKGEEEESLLDTPTLVDGIINLKIKIIRHIFAVREAEQDAVKNAKVQADLKQNLLAIKGENQMQVYKEMSPEDLDKVIDKL